MKRIYIGDIPRDLRRQELEDTFTRVGKIVGVNVHADNQQPYAFVEFESTRDAEEAVKRYDGQQAFGVRIKVQLTTGRPRERPLGTSGTLKRTEYRVIILGLPSSAQWQDVKDFGRPVSWAAAPARPLAA